jgi:hypothetical protein
MTDFSVIYFDYDKQITYVSKSKVKLDSVDNAEAGAPCSVPYDTLDIGDDGKEIFATQYYKGTIICSGQGLYIFNVLC